MPQKTVKKTAKRAAKRATRASKLADGKNLVIVESPAKARTIGRYLGDDYVVQASMGHVRDLPKKDLGVDIDHDFAPTYTVTTERRKLMAELKKVAKVAKAVYLATDLDREGEAIAWHLAETLGVPEDRLHRVVFNEITKSAIIEAFSHPRKVEINRVNAQQARRIMDRIVGYQISPLLWRKVARGLSAGRVQSVAVRLVVEREREIAAFMPDEFWRVAASFTPDVPAGAQLAEQWRQFLATTDEKAQPPTIAAQQQWLGEHGGFKAELTHWRGEKVELHDVNAARSIAEALGMVVDSVIKTENPDGKGPARNLVSLSYHLYDPARPSPAFSVETLKQKTSISKPSGPFTTAALQQAASNYMRFAASRTMRIAQQLYEGIDVPGEGSVGLITYMRTDSQNVSKDAIASVRTLIGTQFGDAYLPDKPNFHASGKRAQEAHEAIRPTDPSRHPDALRKCLTNEQFKLYDLIWRRFVASQMTPARWRVTDAMITAEANAGKALFKATGRQLEFDGYMKVAGIRNGFGGDQLLPALTQGQAVAPVDISATQRFTQPPPRYTEASLVKSLEAEGIGRPSTYASIIQTIQDRAYVEQVDRRFLATDLGMKVTDKLVAHFPRVMDMQFTAHMEDQLDKVEESNLDWIGVLHEFYGPFKQNLDKATENMRHVRDESEPSDYVCDDCGKPMVYRWSKNGRYIACTGYPECKHTAPVDRDGKKVEQKIVPGACPVCSGDMMMRRSRFGPFLGCVKYPECNGTLRCDKDGNALKVVKDEEVTGECPKCGGKMVVKRKGRRAFLGCGNYPTCDGTGPIPDGIALAGPPKEPPRPTGVTCPKCKKKELVIRKGPRGDFVACSGFPRCRNSFNLELLDEVKKAVEEKRDAQAVIDGAKSKGRAGKTAKKAS